MSQQPPNPSSLAIQSVELKSDNIEVNVSQEPGCKVVMEIKVSPQAVKAARHKAIKLVNKEISLPGFRKGKAPENFILEKFGKEVQREMKNVVLQNAFHEAIHLAKVLPFRENEIHCKELEPATEETGAKYSFSFEKSPSIPPISLENMVLNPIPQQEIAEADIDVVVDNIRHHFANWIPVTDRPIQEDDYIDADIDRLDEPTAVLAKDARFHVKEGVLAEWMRSLVMGMNVGESVEGMSEYEGAPPTPEQFIPTHCRITIKKIYVAELPTMDDQLSQRMGVTSYDQLRTLIKRDLNHRAMQKAATLMDEQVDIWLLEHYPFEVPQSVVEDETQHRMKMIIEDLKQRSWTQEKIDAELPKIHAATMEHAKQIYRLFFLFTAFAQQNKIAISEKEVKEAVAQAIMQSPEATSLNQTTGDLRRRIEQQLMMRKCHDYIIAQVQNKIA